MFYQETGKSSTDSYQANAWGNFGSSFIGLQWLHWSLLTLISQMEYALSLPDIWAKVVLLQCIWHQKPAFWSFAAPSGWFAQAKVHSRTSSNPKKEEKTQTFQVLFGSPKNYGTPSNIPSCLSGWTSAEEAQLCNLLHAYLGESFINVVGLVGPVFSFMELITKIRFSIWKFKKAFAQHFLNAENTSYALSWLISLQQPWWGWQVLVLQSHIVGELRLGESGLSKTLEQFHHRRKFQKREVLIHSSASWWLL